MSGDQFGLVVDEDPQDLADFSEARVVNITDEVVEFRIATQGGSPPRKYRLAPYGKDGSSVTLQSGYAKPYKGAGGHHLLEPIVERRTKRHPWPAFKIIKDGIETTIESIQLPMVVRDDRVAGARAAWLREMKRRTTLANSKTAPTPVALTVTVDDKRPAIARVVSPPPADLKGEEVGDDEIEAPPPDPDDPIDAANAAALEDADADVVVPVDEPPPEVPTRARRGGRG